MGDPYTAIRTSRDDFVSQYPDAVAEPVGDLGFAAFGSAPIDLAEKLRRPDFDETQMFLVLVRDEDLYLAFAPDGEPVGYPPEYVRVRVTDWGPDIDPESVRHQVRTESDVDVWSGKLASDLEH
jgi:hypothetical protein